jgi:hypothetical protein
VDAAELLVVLEDLLSRNVPLHKVKVELIQGHPDYLGPDVNGQLFSWVLVGRTLKLMSEDAKESQ